MRLSLPVGSRRFAPPVWAALLYLVVACAMLALGRWQLARADEKIALLESARRSSAQPAVVLERVVDLETAARGHRRVRVAGRWDDERQLLWDNRAHAGRAGYEVVTPVRLADGRLALVNRGWVAPGATRAALPDVSLPPAARDADVVLEGLLSRPSKGFARGPALAEDGPWPRVLQYFDYAAIARAFGEPVVAAVVQARVADAAGTAGEVGLVRRAEVTDAVAGTASDATVEGATDGATDATPDTAAKAVAAAAADGAADTIADAVVDTATDTAERDEATLLVANWRPAASGPEKHYGYAFQWFAMATALTAIFVVVNLSPRVPAAASPSE